MSFCSPGLRFEISQDGCLMACNWRVNWHNFSADGRPHASGCSPDENMSKASWLILQVFHMFAKWSLGSALPKQGWKCNGVHTYGSFSEKLSWVHHSFRKVTTVMSKRFTSFGPMFTMIWLLSDRDDPRWLIGELKTRQISWQLQHLIGLQSRDQSKEDKCKMRHCLRRWIRWLSQYAP